MIAVLAGVVAPGNPAQAGSVVNDSVTVSQTAVAEASDYATLAWGDPWDLDPAPGATPGSLDLTRTTDIYQEKSVGIGSISVQSDPANSANWILHFQTTTSDPEVFLLYQGYGQVVPISVGKYGSNAPIDAGTYSKFSLRMYVDTANYGDAMHLTWTNGNALSGNDPSTFGQTAPIQVYPGWHTYNVDLSAYASGAPASVGGAGNVPWAGQILAVRLDPINQANRNVQIDWARLYNPASPNTSTTVTWTGVTNGSASLLASTTPDASGVVGVVADNLAGAGGSVTWQPANLPPGSYYVVSRVGTDYAAVQTGDPWDFQQATDLMGVPGVPTGIFTGFSAVSIGGGSFSATIADAANAQIFPRIDQDHPINGSVYCRLTMNMTVTGSGLNPGAAPLVVWYPSENSGAQLGSYLSSATPVMSGTHQYTLNLCSNSAWTSSTVGKLLIIPAQGETAGTQLTITGITLSTAGATNPTDINTTITASALPIVVQPLPILTISAPSMTSGPSYPLTTFAHAWDFRSPSSYDATNNITNISFPSSTGGMFHGETSLSFGNPGDPQILLHTGVGPPNYNSTSTPINADYYHYITWRWHLAGTQDTINGWVQRFIWWNQGAGVDVVTTFDQVIDEGWNVYQADLKTLPEEPTGPSNLGHGWTGQQSVLRFDPHEVSAAPSSFDLDYITLTAEDRLNLSPSNTTYPIKFDAERVAAPTTVTAYYTTAQQTTGGTLIGSTTLQPGATAGTINWNAGLVPDGDYYVYLTVTDGLNTGRYVSDAPLKILGTSLNLPNHVYVPLVAHQASTGW